MVKAFKNLVFILGPAAVGIVLGYVLKKEGFSLDQSELVSICTGGLITFSLTAGLLLITMPRSQNRYLERLDRDGRMFGYVASMSIPGILALAATTLSGLKKNENETFQTFFEIYISPKTLAQVIFWASLVSLIWSIYVLKKIIDNANHSGKIPS